MPDPEGHRQSVRSGLQAERRTCLWAGIAAGQRPLTEGGPCLFLAGSGGGRAYRRGGLRCPFEPFLSLDPLVEASDIGFSRVEVGPLLIAEIAVLSLGAIDYLAKASGQAHSPFLEF